MIRIHAQKDGRPPCTLCPEPSVIHLRSPARYLCADHFCEDLIGRVKRTIGSRSMIADGDRIAVAFSGGKDSTALLLILREIIPAWNNIRLVAITVDEGISGYREETIKIADRLTKDLGIEHRIVSFSRMVGKDLDGILREGPERACSICGILRRKALSSAARDAGATLVATGHNLDDEAQAVLMNVLRGDLPRLVRSSGSPSGGCFLPRIKPLMEIPEKEIAVYLMVKGFFPDLPECPYTRYALRAEVRTILSAWEIRHQGAMLKILRGREKLEKALKSVPFQDKIQQCKECGEPCSGTLCQTCLLLRKING